MNNIDNYKQALDFAYDLLEYSADYNLYRSKRKLFNLTRRYWDVIHSERILQLRLNKLGQQED